MMRRHPVLAVFCLAVAIASLAHGTPVRTVEVIEDKVAVAPVVPQVALTSDISTGRQQAPAPASEDDDDDDDDDLDLDVTDDDDDDDDDEGTAAAPSDDDDDDDDYFGGFFDDILGDDDDDDDDEPASVAVQQPAAQPVVDTAASTLEEQSNTAEDVDSATDGTLGEGDSELVDKDPASLSVEQQVAQGAVVVQPVPANEVDEDEDDDDDDDDELDGLTDDDDDDDDDEDEDVAEDDDDDDDDDDLDDLTDGGVIEARKSRELTNTRAPSVYITKYNRFVDHIIGRVNKILRKSYDPVRVRLQSSANKNKGGKGRRDAPTETAERASNATPTKKKSNNRPKARATLFGLSSIRRHGDVTVNSMADHTTVRTNFVLGPLTLRVEKEFGRGAKRELKSATATTAEMHGRLSLRIVQGGAATLHSIKVLQPKQVRVDSADNHDRTREFVWKRSSHIARVVSQKLANATKSMLKPMPASQQVTVVTL